MSSAPMLKKILLIEDDPALLLALNEKFSREGFDVLEAKDGDEGIRVALAERPDLIVLDVLMPKMDGLDLMQTLRKDKKWGESVPIILLTNVIPDHDRIRESVAKNKPTYYLVKAIWSIQDIADKVQEVVEEENNFIPQTKE